MIRALSADVQASLALSRAMLQTVAALSPEMNAAAGLAVDQEMAEARRRAAPQRVVELLEETQARLADISTAQAFTRSLEDALIAAAAALPDIDDRREAYG